MISPNPLAEDLDMILSCTESLWEELRGSKIFITGGTGFVGRWLLESFAWANHHLELKAEAVVLTRNPSAFQKKAPDLASDPAIRLYAADVRDFVFPSGQFSHVIHGATEVNVTLNNENPLLMFDTIVEGTRRTLEFAAKSGARKFLFVSSGAVYGRQPPELMHMAEDYRGAPDTVAPASAYGEGKRAGELLCAMYARKSGIEPKIARCFTFVGPHLPLDTHFAIGNFIRDALTGGPVRVNGDGTPFRSYLYTADLAVWLWTILFKGQPCRAYNVGSAVDVPIREVARTVARILGPGSKVTITKPPTPGREAERYVPSNVRAKTELGLIEHFNLVDSICRTAAWLRASNVAQ